MAKKRLPRETLSKKRDPRVDSDPPPAPPPTRITSPARASASGRPSTPTRSSASSPARTRLSSPAPSATSAERREIRASSPTPPDRHSIGTSPAPRISRERPSDPPPRLDAEVVRSARPASMPRISLLEQELAKERSERAIEADTIAEMLVRVTNLEARAKSAETALVLAERDAETKTRAAREQGSGLAQKIEEAEGRVAELESELRTVKARSAELEKKAKKASADDDLAQRLQAAETAADRASDRARASEERNLEMLDRVSSLQAELASAQQVAADRQSKLEELEAKYDALREAHGSAAATFAATEQKLASVEADLGVAHDKLEAADERRKELESSLASADEKVRQLVAERARVQEEHDDFVAKNDALRKEHAGLAAAHVALQKELADTREHYDKALTEARRTEATRVAALEARNEDTRRVLEGKLEESKHALTEVSQERDRVSTAMTSLAERVATLETREAAISGQLAIATSVFQRANAVFEQIETREKEQAQRRADDLGALRDALRTSFSGLPGKKSRRGSPSIPTVVDVTDDAELIVSMRPPTPPSVAPESDDGWGETDEGAASDEEPET